jgi:hypothetical protein
MGTKYTWIFFTFTFLATELASRQEEYPRHLVFAFVCFSASVEMFCLLDGPDRDWHGRLPENCPVQRRDCVNVIHTGLFTKIKRSSPLALLVFFRINVCVDYCLRQSYYRGVTKLYATNPCASESRQIFWSCVITQTKDLKLCKWNDTFVRLSTYEC